jgi:uncharacterized pyridoxamine 5'-phosphate oxidase family protein
MNKADKKALLRSFLKQNPHVALATVDEKGRPYVATVDTVHDADYNFYFVSPSETRKSRNALTNKQVAFGIGFKLPVTIQGQGKVSLIKDAAERSRIMRMLAANSAMDPGFWPPALNLDAGELLVFRITPTFLRALIALEPDLMGGDLEFVDLLELRP